MKVLEALENGESERTVCEEFSIGKGSVARIKKAKDSIREAASIASKETPFPPVLSPNMGRSRK